MYNSFNKDKVDHLKEPMVFGSPVNIARYDQVAHPRLDDLTQTQLSFFWRPEEVDVTQDAKDFRELSEAEQHIFTSNLKRQILLDSVQGRSPNVAFLPISSLPEYETWVTTWAFSETIHSRSYTHIIRNVYADPGPIFDSIMDNEIILQDAEKITKYYDDFIEYSQYYQLLGIGKHLVNGDKIKITELELRKKYLLAKASVNALEGIRFYVSFACSWAFAEANKMIGNADIISLIARDEALHLVGTQYMINKGIKEDPLLGMAWELVRDEVIDLYREAAQTEKDWAKYLFQYGSMIGLNYEILSEFIEYFTNKRLNAIGLPSIFKERTKNPMRWIDKYLNSNATQAAPQEKDITKYLVGAIRVESDVVDKVNEELKALFS